MADNGADKRHLIVAMTTPLLDGAFDAESFAAHARFLYGAGIRDVFVLGTTGEFQFITTKGRMKVAEAAMHEFGSDVGVMVGTTGSSLKDTIHLSRHAEDIGAYAAVVAPMYIRGISGSEQDLIKGMQELRRSTAGIKFVLYNNPGITNQGIPINALEELSRDYAFRGLKDSSGDKRYMKGALKIQGSFFRVFQGDEKAFMEGPSDDVDGLVSGTANFKPGLLKAACNGDFSLLVRHDLTGILAEYARIGNPIEVIKQRLVKAGIYKSGELAQSPAYKVG